MSSKKDIHVSDLLDSYVKGTLGKSSSEKVKTHLIFCNVCRDHLDRLEMDASPSSTFGNGLAQSHHKPKILPESPEPLPKGMDWHFPLKSAAIVVGMVALYTLFKSRPDSKITPLQSEPKPVPVVAVEDIRPESPVETPKASPAEIHDEMFKELLGDQSGFKEASEQVISNEADWRNLWNRHAQNLYGKTSTPKVDFSQSDVVAIFAGSKPSKGYSIIITEIATTPWNGAPARVFSYRIESPAAGAATAAILTSPFVIKVVPKFNGPNFFRINP